MLASVASPWQTRCAIWPVVNHRTSRSRESENYLRTKKGSDVLLLLMILLLVLSSLLLLYLIGIGDGLRLQEGSTNYRKKNGLHTVKNIFARSLRRDFGSGAERETYEFYFGV